MTASSEDATPNKGGYLDDIRANATLGGAAGSLVGTSDLQSSVDRLTQAVQDLAGKISGAGTLGGGASGGSQQSYGGKSSGFPAMVNPFSANAAGGSRGGNGGSPNISAPQPMSQGGAMASFVQFGRGQLGNQIAMNTYATQTANASGMSLNAANYQAYGRGNQNTNALATSPLDATQMAQNLQFSGGSAAFMHSAMGRASFGATAGIGLTNPALTGAQSSALAAQLYNPVLSQRMRMYGYSTTPRAMGGGAPATMAQITQSMIARWNGGKTKVNQATLYSSLSQGGRDYNSLQALGLNPQQYAPVIEGYNTLFNKGLTGTQAQALFQQASKGGAQGRQAQQRLSQLGVKSASSDVQILKDNQASVTGRDSEISSGFNRGLQEATTGLTKFNSALNSILGIGGLGGAVGYGGGIGASLGHAVGGIGGDVAQGLILKKILGIPFAGGGGATAAAGTGAAATGAESAGGGILGSLGIGGAAAGGAGLMSAVMAPIALLMGKAIDNMLHPSAASKRAIKLETSGGYSHADPRAGSSLIGSTQASMGGGATSIAQTSQGSAKSKPNGGSSAITGSAIKAVDAAKSQLGVPYQMGAESPGVGFDCSALVQWAYRQAGVSLPRTSEDQWRALQKKSVALNSVQEGDLVFMGGADGTAADPGHVGLMISKNQLIQAPHSGADVSIMGYDPREWSHAGRPSGRGGGVMTGGGGSPGNGAGSSTGANQGGAVGNMGMGIGLASTSETDNVTGALGAGGSGGGGGGGGGGFGAAGSGSGTGGPGASTGGGASTKNLKGNKKILNAWAAKYGWGTGGQWNALNTLEMHEAGYRSNAQNPTSTAYGMGQFLDSTWASVGGHKTSDPNLQAEYMMKYIKERYGSPEKAWSQYYNHPGGVGWYSGGGLVNSGMQIVGERGPELISAKQGSSILNNAQTMALLKAASTGPAQTPHQNLANLALTGQTNSQSPQSGSGKSVSLNFNKGAIQINLPSGATSDVSNAGREMAKQFVNHLQGAQIIDAIGTGKKI